MTHRSSDASIVIRDVLNLYVDIFCCANNCTDKTSVQRTVRQGQ
ncbi:MAG: hypothetical protein AAFV25_15375 [Bacteroidota bacterium]